MANESTAFGLVCERIEQRTTLSRIEARGTVRLALKAAGLDAASVRPSEMAVVVRRLLPRELVARGVDDADGIVESLCTALANVTPPMGSGDARPDDVFRRLGG